MSLDQDTGFFENVFVFNFHRPYKLKKTEIKIIL